MGCPLEPKGSGHPPRFRPPLSSVAPLRHDKTAPGLRMKIVEEIVAAGLQRAQVDDAPAARGDHLLDPQADALELDRRRIEIADAEHDRPVGRGVNLRRFEAMI